jgi:outer membrane beta-barrel protein
VPTRFATWVIICLATFSVSLAAQTPKASGADDEAFSDDGENTDVESLYDRYDEAQTKKREDQKKPDARKQPVKEATSLSELSTLAPFSDVAVIQRRFLPRTGRFEFSGSGMSSLNNPFFNNLGLALRGSYNLTEKHGVEFQYMFFSNTRRAVTESLESEPINVRTSNLVTPKSFMGAAYKWTPVYGKITFLNRHIVPFDFVFTGGLGLSKTDIQNEPTVHLGAGQSFAMTKSFAVRWDLVWNFYNAKTVSAESGASTSTNHNDLFLSVGASFFIPEATYR